MQMFSWLGDVAHVDAPVEAPEQHWRPQTRKDCEQVARPCPYVGCRYNLAMDVRGTSLVHAGGRDYGSKTLTLAADGQRVDKWSDDLVTVLDGMSQTCALDVAESNGLTLDEIGDVLGVVKERVSQIEKRGLRKLRSPVKATQMLELLDGMVDIDRDSPLAEAQGYASLEPGDVAAMREAKG